MVFEKHDEIGTEAAATLMQSIFNADIGDPDFSAYSGHAQEVTAYTSKAGPRAVLVHGVKGFVSNDDHGARDYAKEKYSVGR